MDDNKTFNTQFPQTPDGFHERIVSTLAQLPDEKEILTMRDRINRKISIKKMAAVSAAAVMLIGTTVFAGSRITSWVSSSSPSSSYTTLPNSEELQRDVGFQPQLIDQFDNGFSFKEGSITKYKGYDEKNNMVENGKSLTLVYEDGLNQVDLSIMTQAAAEERINSSAHQYEDITIFETETRIKTVPEDYQLTEQDTLDIETGTISLSVGTDEVSVDDYLVLEWDQNGISYSLFVVNSDMTSEDLLPMVYQMINVQ